MASYQWGIIYLKTISDSLREDDNPVLMLIKFEYFNKAFKKQSVSAKISFADTD